METETNDTLDLSKQGLKKLDKAISDEYKNITTLILDHNELQRIDNIDSYSRVENLSICNNFLMRMHGVSKLCNIRELALNNNGILQIEGLKELIYLKVLKLAGNAIKSIEHLNHNMHLEHLDLSNNQITFIADISYLKSLKHLNIERNRLIDLRQCDRYLPTSLEHLGLAHNNIEDLNEMSHLGHLNALENFTIQGNPCVAMAGKSNLGFDYRPFVLNWVMSVKSIDGFVVSAIESLKAEWLYSQGKGRHFHSGQHDELCEYLAQTCPLTADALETEDQRKLRLILSKAQHHQQQLKEHSGSPVARTRLQSPRMQSRISRQVGRSPDRLSSSLHAGLPRTMSPSQQMSLSYSGDIGASPIMTRSFDSSPVSARERDKRRNHEQSKPVNQTLETASKMVPVPESLMSPDYQEPMYDLQKIPKHKQSVSLSSQSSNSSLHEEKNQRRPVKGSPKPNKSATPSPKPKTKVEHNKLTPKDNRVNGISKQSIEYKKPEIVEPNNNRLASQRQKSKTRSNIENNAAIKIQKMWRGYRSRNLNRETLRILHAIQAARARQHIHRLTCDMEATKAALESERKIQQLQMQAINALWKKVSTLQATETKHRTCETDDSDVLTQRIDNLQLQMVELKGSMQEVLKAVGGRSCGEPIATQTDITAVTTPQEERSVWLKRPQSLALVTNIHNPLPQGDNAVKDDLDGVSLKTAETESLIEDLKLHNEVKENMALVD